MKQFVHRLKVLSKNQADRNVPVNDPQYKRATQQMPDNSMAARFINIFFKIADSR